jgi:hypothetical protein
MNMRECRHGFTLMQTRGLRFPPQPRYLSKSPKKRSSPPPDPPVELLHRERCSITRALSTCLSKSPETKPSPPSRFPLQSPYVEKDAPSPEPSLHIFKVPRKEAPLQVPFSEPHRIRRSVPRTLLYLSLAVPGGRPPPPPHVPHQGPDGGICSSPEPTLHTSQNVQ